MDHYNHRFVYVSILVIQSFRLVIDIEVISKLSRVYIPTTHSILYAIDKLERNRQIHAPTSELSKNLAILAELRLFNPYLETFGRLQSKGMTIFYGFDSLSVYFSVPALRNDCNTHRRIFITAATNGFTGTYKLFYILTAREAGGRLLKLAVTCRWVRFSNMTIFV